MFELLHNRVKDNLKSYFEFLYPVRFHEYVIYILLIPEKSKSNELKRFGCKFINVLTPFFKLELAKKCSQSWKIILFFPENQHILHTYSLGPLANQHISRIKFTKHLRKIMPWLQTAKKKSWYIHICQHVRKIV